MPVSLLILLAFIIAVAGAAVAITTKFKRLGIIVMLLGLLAAGSLSLLLVFSLRNM